MTCRPCAIRCTAAAAADAHPAEAVNFAAAAAVVAEGTEVLHLMLHLSPLLVSVFTSGAGVFSDAVLGHDGIGGFAVSWCWLWHYYGMEEVASAVAASAIHAGSSNAASNIVVLAVQICLFHNCSWILAMIAAASSIIACYVHWSVQYNSQWKVCVA